MQRYTMFVLVAAALCMCLSAGQPTSARAADEAAPVAASASAEPAETTASSEAAVLPPLSEEEVNAILASLGDVMAAMPEMGMPAPGSYYISKTLDLGYDDTVVKLKEALAAEKFAVLTEIDLQAKFKEKLQIDIPRYTIFGACGAKWAHAIWEKEFHIGALMPCNVVVAELPDGKTEVFFKDPGQLPMATGNPEIAETVATVKASVERIMAAL